MQRAKRLHKRVLRQLFCARWIADDPDDDAEDAALVPANQLPKCVLGPCERFLDQLTVCSSHQPRSLSTFASNWIYGIGLRSVAKLGFMVNFAGLTLWPETPPSHAAAYPGS